MLIPNPFRIPTEVSVELTTFVASVVPVSVLAAAVTVIAAEQSKFTPLIARGVVRVAADPVVDWFNVGKSAAIAMEGTPVAVVFFKIPVAKPARLVPFNFVTVAAPVTFPLPSRLPEV